MASIPGEYETQSFSLSTFFDSIGHGSLNFLDRCICDDEFYDSPRGVYKVGAELNRLKAGETLKRGKLIKSAWSNKN